MKKFKWGILGPGRIAEKLAEAIQQSDNGEVYAIGSRSLDKAANFAKRFGASKSYTSYEELCADDKLDIIYIATPHSFHCEHSLLAMKHGRNVLCEKPFALDAEEATKMITCAKENNVFLMEAMWSRLLPGMKKVKNLLEQNAIGSVKKMTADFCFTSSPQEKARLFEPSLGGGALLDVGIYPLTLACSFFGFPIKFEAKADLTDKGVDATSHYYLEFANGAKAELYSSMVQESKGEAIIEGEEGRIIIHPKAWTLKEVTLENGKVETFDTSYEGSDYLLQVEEVHKCLNKGMKESSINSFEWTLSMMHLMDDLREKMAVNYKLKE
ncbi:Gfo/Idh/MocA family oxidoreductase [Lentisphaera marina]|uniref:Gfo/Idh/MocA family protein n=1 Tax=Lentisphaera marina TaxID=1111041 RepID=UPI0023672ECF|nr:Gfo/Idh/MocA family oxidoreductase [Lentisphaera marina]MDD7986368.1 Gfo/Idh/MocA family oxidoreductase [Lentisphaera marina]